MSYAVAIALLVACNSSTDVPVANHAAPVPAPSTTSCIPTAEPADAVVQITRSTLPIGGPATEERGAVTHGGVCPPTIGCKQVDAATMSAIWVNVARAATIDHGPPSSPHYGGRWIAASWAGGSCEIADSQQTPVAPASEQRFDAAYDAVAKRFASP